MKKYIQPETTAVKLNTDGLLAASSPTAVNKVSSKEDYAKRNSLADSEAWDYEDW